MATDDREGVSAPPFTPLLNSCNSVTSQNQKSCDCLARCVFVSQKLTFINRDRQKNITNGLNYLKYSKRTF